MAVSLGHRAKVEVTHLAEKDDASKSYVLPTTGYNLNQTTEDFDITNQKISDNGIKTYAVGLADGSFNTDLYFDDIDEGFKVLEKANIEKSEVFLKIFKQGYNKTNDRSANITYRYQQGSYFVTNFSEETPASGPIKVSVELKPSPSNPIEIVEPSGS